MSNYEKITSFQNSKIKLAKQLQDKKHRQETMRFTIDYARDLERALAFGYEVDFVVCHPSALTADELELLHTLPQHSIFEVSADILEKAGYRQNPSGILAVLHAKPTKNLADLTLQDAMPILGLVGLEKPGNIGALLRTADATGFKRILFIDIALDIYNPNIIRASTGANFLDNIYTMTTQQAYQFFKSQKYSIISAHLNGTKSLFDVSFTSNTAILLGAEDEGLSAFWENNCDQLVKIPMIGQLSDSLNVSVSGAVFMYEALRQHLSS